MSELKKYTDELFENDCRIINRSCRNVLGSSISKELRAEHDFYATPLIATEKLIDTVKFDKDVGIYDPCVGKGHILKPFRDRGFVVRGTDIVARHDLWNKSVIYDGACNFLNYDKKIDENVVTNPPYKLAFEFVEHAIGLLATGRQLCALLKIQFLETRRRYEFFKKYPPKYICVFSDRISCIPGGCVENAIGGAMCFAWFVWQKDFSCEPVVKWLTLE